jgi:CubicO group peptidase (beta-lactamase class C family)
MHVVKGGPAGGGYSTVEDLVRFDVALRQNKLISKESFDTLTTAKVGNYAYLFGDRKVNGQRVIGHNGGTSGVSAALDMYLDSGYSVAVMSNYDEAAFKVASQIQRALTQ